MGLLYIYRLEETKGIPQAPYYTHGLDATVLIFALHD